MARRPLAALCAAIIVTTTGCISFGPKHADRAPKNDRPTTDGKPTTASPVVQASPTHESAPPTQTPSEQPSNAEKVVDDPAAALEAIQRKSQAYAQSMEMLMKQRTDEPGSRGSAVQWASPKDLQLSMGTPDAPIPQMAEVRGKSQPKPNRDPATTGPANTETYSDVSNMPLALGEVNERPAVASVTSSRPGSLEQNIPLNTQQQTPPVQAAQQQQQDNSLLAKLAKRVKENPRDVASHIEYQLLLFLLDEQVPNLASISTLPQEDRELVTAILDGLSNERSTLRRDANLMTAEKIRPMVELADRLKTNAELTIPTLVLAKVVDGFGRYETMEARLIAGKDTPAIIYAEIENFSSQFNSEQMWETNLSMEVSLFSEMGPQVYTDAPATITDTSRSRRHDFFVRKLIKFPANLTIGRYVLKVTMVDTQSNRVAETSLPLQVVAQ